MPQRNLTHAAILALLAQTLLRIGALTAQLPPEQGHTPPPTGGWPISAVLAHLRSCADVWGTCIDTILADDFPTLRAINPTAWVRRTTYLTQDVQSSVRALSDQRAALLAILTPLADDSWARTATVTGAGRPLTRSVRFYAEWLATHERSHVKQIARIAGAVPAGQP